MTTIPSPAIPSPADSLVAPPATMTIPAPRTSCQPTVLQVLDKPTTAQLAEWDRLVEGTPGTDVTQLSSWATIRARAGYRPTYLLVHQGGTLVGGALVLRRKIFGVLGVGYLPYGPMIASGANRAEVRTSVVEGLLGLAGKVHLMFVQPPEHADDVSEALLCAGFRPSTAGIAPAGSYRLDLTCEVAQIRAGFSKRLKSWTNRWPDKGVTVRRGDEHDLPLLVELMALTGARHGFTPPPLDYVRTLYTELSRRGNVALFVGEVHGVPVCADVVTLCGPMVRGRLGGFDCSGAASKLSVPAAVRWEIIKWARAEGYRWLDFGGLPERMLVDMIDHGIENSDDWPAAHRGKLSFNGTPFRYPTPVELIRRGPTRFVYDLVTRNEHGQHLLRWAKQMMRGNRGRRTAKRA